MTGSITRYRGTKEYLEAVVGPVSVPLDMEVELALTRGNDDHVWLPAGWTGTVGTTRTAQTTSPITFDDTYPHSAYSLYVRLVDTPEEPIRRVATVYILGQVAAVTP